MYSIIKAVIDSKRFELTDMLAKIDTIWVQCGISDNQRKELIELARSCAVAANSFPTIPEQLSTLSDEVAALKEQVRAQADRITILEGGTVETPEPVEWPEFVKPASLRDAYNKGDKISYQGKHYVCKLPGTVWPPDTYPLGWDLVE